MTKKIQDKYKKNKEESRKPKRTQEKTKKNNKTLKRTYMVPPTNKHLPPSSISHKINIYK